MVPSIYLKMKAAYIYEHGSSDKIEIGNLDTPKIDCNDVLIKIKYAALNHIDLFVVKGWSGFPISILSEDPCS
jgi:NADPH:quinone reductase-like Zn-dependent oxidoreductase